MVAQDDQRHLVGAGLLLASLARLNAANPGVRPDGVVAAHVALAHASKAEPGGVEGELVEWLRAHPGVISAGAVSRLPVGGPGFQLGRVFLREGQPEPPASNDTPAEWVVATPSSPRWASASSKGARSMRATPPPRRR